MALEDALRSSTSAKRQGLTPLFSVLVVQAVLFPLLALSGVLLWTGPWLRRFLNESGVDEGDM